MANGQVINIGKERFTVPEAMFQLSFLGMESNGVHETIYNSVMKCDVHICKGLYANIVLSGNITLFSGFRERLKDDVIALAPSATQVDVITSPDQEYLPWKGGKMLVPIFSANSMWLTKAEYSAQGPIVVHRRFFWQ